MDRKRYVFSSLLTTSTPTTAQGATVLITLAQSAGCESDSASAACSSPPIVLLLPVCTVLFAVSCCCTKYTPRKQAKLLTSLCIFADSVLGLNDSEPAEPAPFPYGYVMGGLTILVFLVALWAIGVWLCYRCRRSRRNKQATQPLIIYSHAATPFVSGATTPTIPQTHLGVPSQSMHSMRARNGTTQWVNSPHTQQSMNAAEASAASASTWPNRTSMQSYTPLDTPGAKGSSTGGDSSLAEVYKAAFPTKAGCTTFAHTAMGLLAAPGPEASSECKQEYVQYQIDSLVGQVLLDGLVLQEGFRTRLLGGVHVPMSPYCIRVFNALELSIALELIRCSILCLLSSYWLHLTSFSLSPVWRCMHADHCIGDCSASFHPVSHIASLCLALGASHTALRSSC